MFWSAIPWSRGWGRSIPWELATLERVSGNVQFGHGKGVSVTESQMAFTQAAAWMATGPQIPFVI